MNTRSRVALAAALLMPLGALVTTTGLASASASDASETATAAQRATVKTSLRKAARALPVSTEQRTGYDRDLFRHWNAGLSATDGCDTRDEVGIAEATTKPSVGTPCAFTGGQWFSVYDNTATTDYGTFDVDHSVALAEAWDSGAHAWDAATREAYANDQGYANSLIAVSASSNRSKGDKDPAEWMPTQTSYACTYIKTWVSVKTRWSLSVDAVESKFLISKADSCPRTTVKVTKATITTGTTPDPTDDPTPNPGGAALQIASITFDPPGTDTDLNTEFVTLRNASASPLELSGWALEDNADHRFAFPAGAPALDPGKSVVVHTGSGTTTLEDGTLRVYAGFKIFIWNNTGDTATLYAPGGSAADSCSYSGSGSTIAC